MAWTDVAKAASDAGVPYWDLQGSGMSEAALESAVQKRIDAAKAGLFDPTGQTLNSGVGTGYYGTYQAPGDAHYIPDMNAVFGGSPYDAATAASALGPTGINTGGMNPQYFGSDAAAQKIAQMVGGTVVKAPAQGGVFGGGATDPEANWIQMPNGTKVNAGQIATMYSHGYPQQYIDQMIARETGAQDVNGSALYPLPGGAAGAEGAAGAGAGGTGAAPGTPTGIGPGMGFRSRGGLPQSPGSLGGGRSLPGGAGGYGYRSMLDRGANPVNLGGGRQGSGVPIDLSGGRTAAVLGNLANNPQGGGGGGGGTGGGPAGAGGAGGGGGIGSGRGGFGSAGAASGSVGSGTPPGRTFGSGPAGAGGVGGGGNQSIYYPPGQQPGNVPNAQYLNSAFPYWSRWNGVPYTGGDPGMMATSEANRSIDYGNLFQSSFGPAYAGYMASQGAYGNAADSAYSQLWQTPGFTNAEQGGILNGGVDGGLSNYMATPGDYAGNYLSPGEQAGMFGNPNAVSQVFDPNQIMQIADQGQGNGSDFFNSNYNAALGNFQGAQNNQNSILGNYGSSIQNYYNQMAQQLQAQVGQTQSQLASNATNTNSNIYGSLNDAYGMADSNYNTAASGFGGAIGSTTSGLNSNLQDARSAYGTALGGANAGFDQSLSQMQTGVNGATSQMGSQLGQNLGQTAAGVRQGYQTSLGELQGNLSNYNAQLAQAQKSAADIAAPSNFGAMAQSVAAGTVGSQYQTAEDRIEKDAAASGNVNPLSLAASRDRMLRQTSIQSASAMNSAYVDAERQRSAQQAASAGLQAQLAQSGAQMGYSTALQRGQLQADYENQLGQLGYTTAATTGNAAMQGATTLGQAGYQTAQSRGQMGLTAASDISGLGYNTALGAGNMQMQGANSLASLGQSNAALRANSGLQAGATTGQLGYNTALGAGNFGAQAQTQLGTSGMGMTSDVANAGLASNLSMAGLGNGMYQGYGGMGTNLGLQQTQQRIGAATTAGQMSQYGAQYADTNAAARAATIAQNRQATGFANQGQLYSQGYNTNNAMSQRYTALANQRIAGQQAARNYYQSQNQFYGGQSNQAAGQQLSGAQVSLGGQGQGGQIAATTEAARRQTRPQVNLGAISFGI